MATSRMFGDDEPESSSPRTTIVGGRPPESPGVAPPVPTGMQRLLRLASVDREFKRELIARRSAMAGVADVPLTASERAILDAVPAAQLAAMIDGLPPPEEDRRTFLRETAATAVMLLGGAALAACDKISRPATRVTETEGGISPELRTAPDAADRIDRRMQAPGGAAPDIPRPQHNETNVKGGIDPNLESVDRVERNEMPSTGGIDPHIPSASRGIRPDIPPPQPVPKSRGISPDVPPPKTAGISPDVPPPKK